MTIISHPRHSAGERAPLSSPQDRAAAPVDILPHVTELPSKNVDAMFGIDGMGDALKADQVKLDALTRGEQS